MTPDPFKLSHEALLEFAREGVTMAIGINTGNPDWTVEDYAFHIRAQKEIEYRLKRLRERQAKEEKNEQK
jgi:hypothetical protein